MNQQTANPQPVVPSQTTNKTNNQVQPDSQFQVIPQQPTFVQVSYLQQLKTNYIFTRNLTKTYLLLNVLL